MRYRQKIQDVCRFIEQNLDEDLSLGRLCRIAALSSFHFHRIFSACCGIGLAKFVLMTRLKRASFQLVFRTDMQVTDIAYDAAFGSPEAFARTFRKIFGQSPSQFRKSPDWVTWHQCYQFEIPRKEITMNVRIITQPQTQVAVLEHRGSPERVLETVSLFIDWRKATGLSPVKTSRSFGVPYGDPAVVAPEDFRFDVCGSVTGDVPENVFGVRSGLIPGGRFAVARHFGSRDNIAETVYGLYRDWLPDSGEAVRDYPCFFEYLNLFPDVAEHELETDVYLPLE